MKHWLAVGGIAIAMCAVATSAYAYDETGTGKACVACHGADTSEASGPHGGYTATSSKCVTCHSVHKAPPDGIVLLPAATILQTCETCHDGTGGQGVYGVIAARTGVVTPTSDHSMVGQTSIPGGDVATGGALDNVSFSGVGGVLTCTDCHSPHGSNVVNAFPGDRARSVDSLPPEDLPDTTAVVSSRLLRKEPTGALSPTNDYGSSWCAACHAGRLDHPLTQGGNHSVSTTVLYKYVRYYDGSWGPLGRSNSGYVMPGKQVNGGPPICQQCHEDARHVGDDLNYKGMIAPGEEFRVTAVDGSPDDPTGSTDNPRFQVFPHESTNAALLVETDNDLCTNCHPKK